MAGIPLGTHLHAVTFSYLSFVTNNLILNLIGICYRIFQLGSFPGYDYMIIYILLGINKHIDDHKIFDVTINLIQWLLILYFLWTSVSSNNDKRYLCIWLGFQLAITLVTILRIPIVLKELFSLYSEIYYSNEFHLYICPIYCQIFAFYLLWLGIQLQKIKDVTDIGSREETKPIWIGFRKTLNYYSHTHQGYGLIVLLVTDMIGSLANLIDEVYEVYLINNELADQKNSKDIQVTTSEIVLCIRIIMDLWVISSLIQSKQERIYCSVFWSFMYLIYLIYSLADFISVLIRQLASDSDEYDIGPEDNSWMNVFIAVPLLMSTTDLLFRLIIFISVVCFIIKKKESLCF